MDCRAAEILIVDQTHEHPKPVAKKLESYVSHCFIRWIKLSEASIPLAMNAALKESTEDIVLFLDDDIVPDKEIVIAHAQAHSDFPGRLVAGRVLQPWHNGAPDSSKKSFEFNSLQAVEVTEFMGGNFSVIREDALKIGGFDENFVKVAYRFEAEFAHRWRASGRRIWYKPEALVHHIKESKGGTRSYGNHMTTMKPDHSVGAYYFFLRTSDNHSRWLKILGRLSRSILTRHHLRRPWWIPVTIIGEIRGLIWAGQLTKRGPRYGTGTDCNGVGI